MEAKVATQIDYWDRVASEKTFSHPVRLDWLREALNGSLATVVDFGCGYGRTLTELSFAGYQHILGIDFSAAMLARCRSALPVVPLIRSDTLPLATASIDAILLFAVLTCIPDSHEQEKLIAAVSRGLRPGGLIYISDLLINDDSRNRARYEQYAKQFNCYGVFELPEGVVVRHHRREWIDELTRPFERLQFEPFEVTTMNGNKSAAFQYLGRKKNKS
ncbi:MAG TPA: class I SAM-dependent methyltransferase [Pyrinomonadaceae bacterium]|nr:class I SAM-dependent methyltransferase [Pyrinomonadaceae bacterium]